MKPRRKRLLAGLAGALVVNLLLFGLLPVLVGTQSSGTDLEDITAVQLVDVTPPAPPPEKEETSEPPKPPEPPKIMPAMTMPRKPVDVPRMDLQLPDLNFEINPQLAAGMAVAAPPAEAAPAPAALSSDLFSLEEVDQVPAVQKQVKPPYPQRAKRLNVEGVVEVRFLVNQDGSVSDVEIVSATPAGMFEDSVLKTLPRWKFSPGKKDGQLVRTRVVTSIKFELTR